MNDVLDLERYPLDGRDPPALAALVRSCRDDFAAHGMFNLDGMIRPAGIERAVRELTPLSERRAFTHERRHNVYFDDAVGGLPADHSALQRFDTVHHTLCDDQLAGTLVHELYEWAPLRMFLARVLDKPHLYLMSDALARVNVIRYSAGETLNWHFDRSLFTTTLLIQAADEGGEFEYRSNLRSDTDANHAGVARVLAGADDGIRINPLAAGTLNIFAGKNTLHRVSTVRGRRDRIIAVFSYYEQPDVQFSAAERMGFYGRTG
jgi:hypothetical protein